MGTLLVTALPGLTGCNSILGNSKKEELLERYQDGFSKYKEGAEKHNDAVIAYRSDEFETVQSRIDEALEDLQAAKTDFERVRQLAKEIDNTDAIAIASSAVNQTELLIEASNQLKRTAEGFANNNYEKAQESYEGYKETAAEVRNQDLTEPQVLKQTVDDGVLDF